MAQPSLYGSVAQSARQTSLINEELRTSSPLTQTYSSFFTLLCLVSSRNLYFSVSLQLLEGGKIHLAQISGCVRGIGEH